VLARLGVFLGGFELASATAVAGDDELGGMAVEDAVAALVDQSLVRRIPEAPGRTELLEPIREYAIEQLRAAGELDHRRTIHATHFLALAEEAAPHLAGDDQGRWLDRMERERDNFRAAIGWAVDAPLPAIAVRLAFMLWRFWQKRGYLDEAAARLTKIVAADWSPADPAGRAKVLEAFGGVRYWQGRFEDAREPYAEATAIWRRLGDGHELANALYNEAFTRTGDDPRLAAAMLEEAAAIFREVGDDAGLGNVLWASGTAAIQAGDATSAEPQFLEARERFRRAGERTMEAWADHMLGATLAYTGRHGEGETAFLAALDHFASVGDVAGVSIVLSDLGIGAHWRRDFERAAHLDLMAIELARTTGVNVLQATIASWPALWNRTQPADLPPGRWEEIAVEVAGWSLDDMLAYARATEPARRSVPEPEPRLNLNEDRDS
jgi:tetratricopeptide (TPR) repeat protein